jgi:hypothetical protein
VQWLNDTEHAADNRAKKAQLFLAPPKELAIPTNPPPSASAAVSHVTRKENVGRTGAQGAPSSHFVGPLHDRNPGDPDYS